jgi:hypothetical protein
MDVDLGRDLVGQDVLFQTEQMIFWEREKRKNRENKRRREVCL